MDDKLIKKELLHPGKGSNDYTDGTKVFIFIIYFGSVELLWSCNICVCLHYMLDKIGRFS